MAFLGHVWFGSIPAIKSIRYERYPLSIWAAFVLEGLGIFLYQHMRFRRKTVKVGLCYRSHYVVYTSMISRLSSVSGIHVAVSNTTSKDRILPRRLHPIDTR